MKTNQIIMIIVGAIIVYIIYYNWNYDNQNYNRTPKEYFSPFASSQELDQYWSEPTAGIENHLVDTMTCSKECCGDANMPTYDGLTSNEIYQAYSTIGPTNGPYVRTNYMCANGIGGQGCPCIDKSTYKFIVNHGQENAKNITQIEPTFLLGDNVHNKLASHNGPYNLGVNPELSPYEVFQSQRSMFVDSPRLNDLELQRTPNPVDNVVSVPVSY